MEPNRIVVIQPGSQNLRIGLASETNPVTMLHAIAHKQCPEAVDLCWRDELIQKPDIPGTVALQDEFDKQRLKALKDLQTYYADKYKRPRAVTPLQSLAMFNRDSKPELITQTEAGGGSSSSGNLPQRNVLFGDDILELSADDSCLYNIHFPIRRGELNIHSGIGGSLTAVLSQLESIWEHAIEQRLGIGRSQLRDYGFVLVINDIYNCTHVRETLRLLFNGFGFKSGFIVQDHVAATFGAAQAGACVVDIGDQKTSISCVEEGFSQFNTRLRLPVGGNDITCVFLMFLQRCAFPYRDCNVQDSYADAKLLTQLKERHCHLQVSLGGAHEQAFYVRGADGHNYRYELQMGDECLLAPLTIFSTRLLTFIGRNRRPVRESTSRQSDSEDCYDAEYLRECGRRIGGGREASLDDEEYSAEIGDNVRATKDEIESSVDKEPILSLDQAVIQSIDRCCSLETKRKMFGAILLVGDASKTPGLREFLADRISAHLSKLNLNDQAPIDVNIVVKDIDAGTITWRGAAVMANLETARELWITGAMWNRYGVRTLRERAPLVWKF